VSRSRPPPPFDLKLGRHLAFQCVFSLRSVPPTESIVECGAERTRRASWSKVIKMVSPPPPLTSTHQGEGERVKGRHLIESIVSLVADEGNVQFWKAAQ